MRCPSFSPDNTFDILFNENSLRSGNLLEDFTPAVNPPAEIDDPEDFKPEDWVDTEYIADPDATKVRTLFEVIIKSAKVLNIYCFIARGLGRRCSAFDS